MFQYSICRIAAEKNGYNFYIPYTGKIKECFPNLELGTKDGETTNTLIDGDRYQHFDPEFLNIPDFTHLSGFFQSPKYFIGYEDKIKSWFNIEMDDKVKSIIDEYPVDEFCYLHIRGNDYKTDINNWLLPKSYFERAVLEMKKINSISKFVIVTDDVNYCNQILPGTPVICNDFMTDFKCLYYSRYTIISNSSFSWWSCWLSLEFKKCVIAPDRWLNYNRINQGFWPADIKCEEFIYI